MEAVIDLCEEDVVNDDAPKCNQCASTKNLIQEAGFCHSCLTKLMLLSKMASPTKIPTQVSSSRAISNKSSWTLHGVLSYPEGNQNATAIKTLPVVEQLAKKLKPHQKEGVEFVWNNCFSDVNYFDKGDQSKIGGCILAHFMGLGKSLTTITVLHTALKCPSLKVKAARKPLLHTVLLVVPANTLPNWENEVNKWTEELDHPLNIFNLGKARVGYQDKEIKQWYHDGGLLALSDVMCLKVCEKVLKLGQPDILVVDEAHTMLKNNKTKIFQKLQLVKTKRRILLTGTPLQNNVTEYFHLMEFIRPGAIGVDSILEFEKTYRIPIERGLPCDAEVEVKLESLQKQAELKRKLDPYIHRKNAKVLRDDPDLPVIQDTLLYLQPSTIQTKIVRIHKKKQIDGVISKNFLKLYADLCPMLNHPGCLKIEKGGHGKNISWKSSGDPWLVAAENGSLSSCLKSSEYQGLDHVRNSPKFIILAHILALAFRAEEKVLVYSKCLKTLDMVEQFLCSPDWKGQVGSLKDFSEKLGGLKKNCDYSRIDGRIESGKRGELVDKFNGDADSIKIFLISSLAGGIGINLCSASVVVILDNHFNPSVSQQCISRAHRYGQKKQVRCFRLAIENTIEATVYARSENKTGVATCVLDGRFAEGKFSAEELNDLFRIVNIVQCEKCGRKRLLPESQDPPEDGEEWFCSMNEDAAHNSCNVPEDEKLKRAQDLNRKEQADETDPFLQHLSTVVNKATRKTKLVTGYLPVETGFDTVISCEEAIERLKEEIAGRGNISLTTNSKRKFDQMNAAQR